MPVANIHVLAGHPRPVLKQLLREASATFARVIEAPPDRLQVWITEIDPQRVRVMIDPVHPDRWAIGGVAASVARAGELAARNATA